TVYFVIYYIGNKKNSLAAKQILYELIQSFYVMKSSKQVPVFENITSFPSENRQLSSIRSIKCRNKWYKMVAAVDVVFDNNCLDKVLDFLKDVNYNLLSKKPFSYVHLDVDTDIFNRISYRKDCYDIVTSISKTRAVKSFFKNEFYIIEHLTRNFRKLKRFSNADKLEIYFHTVSEFSPQLILSFIYSKLDGLLEIGLSFNGRRFERRLMVKSFSTSKIFEPVIFNLIIDLFFEEDQSNEIMNFSLTSYRLSFIRSFGKLNQCNYSGTIRSDNSSFFLRIADLILFNRETYSCLGEIQEFLADYYVKNRRKILNTQRQRILKKVTPETALKYSIAELQAINIWKMTNSRVISSNEPDLNGSSEIPLLTSDELHFLDRIKRIVRLNPSQRMLALSFVELLTLVNLAKKSILKIFLKKEIYNRLVNGINSSYILKKENYCAVITKKGMYLISSLQTVS
ncbi:MAG: hypothetical protein ACTSP4_01120, partial [Candidatus Hodarchaeales archaeon]